jgi:hypothetical protein
MKRNQRRSGRLSECSVQKFYWGEEPVEGPRTQCYFLNVYYSLYGREIFRLRAEIADDPPRKRGVFKRILNAIVQE